MAAVIDFAAARVAAAAAKARSQGEDPHVAWWDEMEPLIEQIDQERAAGNDATADVMAKRTAELYRLCIDTPAETLEGMAVVLRAIRMNEDEGTDLDTEDWDALTLVIDRLERLAGL